VTGREEGEGEDEGRTHGYVSPQFMRRDMSDPKTMIFPCRVFANNMNSPCVI
jgi:hypothetical protein